MVFEHKAALHSSWLNLPLDIYRWYVALTPWRYDPVRKLDWERVRQAQRTWQWRARDLSVGVTWQKQTPALRPQRPTRIHAKKIFGDVDSAQGNSLLRSKNVALLKARFIHKRSNRSGHQFTSLHHHRSSLRDVGRVPGTGPLRHTLWATEQIANSTSVTSYLTSTSVIAMSNWQTDCSSCAGKAHRTLVCVPGTEPCATRGEPLDQIGQMVCTSAPVSNIVKQHFGFNRHVAEQQELVCVSRTRQTSMASMEKIARCCHRQSR